MKLETAREKMALVAVGSREYAYIEGCLLAFSYGGMTLVQYAKYAIDAINYGYSPSHDVIDLRPVMGIASVH